MRFKFNEEKTAQAAAFLIQLNGGRLNYTKLIKLLYLSDRRSLIETGSPITGDKLVSMTKGPVLSEVLDLIHHGPFTGEGPSPWFAYISPNEGYDVLLVNRDFDTGQLSNYEKRILAENFEKYGRMYGPSLIVLLHQILPEWKDPQGFSITIQPADILRAADVPDEEIESLSGKAEETFFIDSLPR